MKTRSGLKFRRPLAVLLLAAASGVLLAPSSILAQARQAQANWLQYRLGVQVTHGPGTFSYDSGLVQNTNLLTTSLFISPDEHDDAYAHTSLSDGGLQLNGGSAVNNSPSDGDGYLTYFGNSAASFQDTLTLTAPTLPVNSPVQVQVACVYAGFSPLGFSLNEFDGANSGASAAITVNNGGYPNVTGAVGVTLQTNTITLVVSALTGTGGAEGLVIIPSVTVNGGVYDGDGLSMFFAFVASVASQTYVDVLTPGASYTSASGTVYPTLLSSSPPTLGIQPATNGVTLFWPVTTIPYRLQQNSDLATANWVSNSLPINVVNGTNQVTVSPAQGNQFFRLINP